MNLRVYRKDNTKRNIIICVVSFFIIIILFFLIYFINKKRNISNGEVTENNIAQEESIEEKKSEPLTVILDPTKIEENKKLPMLTEIGKEKMRNIYNSDKKVAYLTFDDGPSKNITPLILDALREQDVKATFFVLGSRVKSNPDLIKREYNEGHYIANHGYTHEYSKIYSSEEATLDEYNIYTIAYLPYNFIYIN